MYNINRDEYERMGSFSGIDIPEASAADHTAFGLL